MRVRIIVIEYDDDVEGDVDDEVQCWVRACVHRQSVREARGSCSNWALKGRLAKMSDCIAGGRCNCNPVTKWCKKRTFGGWFVASYCH